MFAICDLIMFSSFSLQVFAKEETTKVIQEEQENETIVPMADVIETIYRIYNDKLQCRRWNKTWGYWVDADGITL